MPKPLSQNRRATFDYEILKRFEAGLSLQGGEVKSIQQGRCDLAGANVLVRGTKAFLINADIPAYQPQNTPSEYDPKRNRPLLLNAREIAELAAIGTDKKLTIVPISVYTKNHRLKLEIAIARRKKKSDKREAIKKRDSQKEMRRAAVR